MTTAVTRYEVLETLAAASDSDGATTTVEAIVAETGADRGAVADHLRDLMDCELARRHDDGVRVTLTGEQLLELGVDPPVVVDASDPATAGGDADGADGGGGA